MKTIFFLLGPTASGKTDAALQLASRFPLEIISVDSTMIYRDMDIGSAKPDRHILKEIPHHLINILDPRDAYSAGQFRADVLQLVDEIISRGKTPLLVGGTMLYFKVLQHGIAELPKADQEVRDAISLRAKNEGWETLHSELAMIDSQAARRIHPNDQQRIQRALEVFYLSGKSITTFQTEDTHLLSAFKIHAVALIPYERKLLHERIAQRFEVMITRGFLDEVAHLYHRGDLTLEMPSMRSVGYRQAWLYFSQQLSFEEMKEQAIVATRQLAKRQLTWLRSWPSLHPVRSDCHQMLAQLMDYFASTLN